MNFGLFFIATCRELQHRVVATNKENRSLRYVRVYFLRLYGLVFFSLYISAGITNTFEWNAFTTECCTLHHEPSRSVRAHALVADLYRLLYAVELTSA